MAVLGRPDASPGCPGGALFFSSHQSKKDGEEGGGYGGEGEVSFFILL